VRAALQTLVLAIRFARRELRQGLRGFVIFLLCLALGVTAIAAAGSLGETFRRGIAQQSRTLLGGDIAFSLKQRRADQEELAWIGNNGTVSTVLDLRTMAGPPTARRLVQLRAVDSAYPLVGAAQMQNGQNIHAALAFKDGLPGIAMTPAGLADFSLTVGDIVRVGSHEVYVGGVLLDEPDRLGLGGGLGQRMLISDAGLDMLGLAGPGALYNVTYRLILPKVSDPEAFVKTAKAHFEDSDFSITDRENAANGLTGLIGFLETFLAVIGLAALVAGGLGVSQAVNAFLDQRRAAIATLKALGADQNLIRLSYGLQLLVLALGGAMLGVVFGALAPFAVMAWAGDRLPLPAAIAIYPVPLIVALGEGLLAAAMFALPALGRARATPPAALYRGAVERTRFAPWPEMLTAIVCGAGFAALAILTSPAKILTLLLLIGASLAFLLFVGLSHGMMWLARRAARHSTGLPRMVFASLGGPGSAARTAGPALGLGFALLGLVMLVQSNLVNQISTIAPKTGPSLVLTQIPADQTTKLDALLQDNGLNTDDASRYLRGAFLTGRIHSLNGIRIDRDGVKQSERWAIDNEIGMSIIAGEPENTQITDGKWWPADYSGPALISLEDDVAKGVGIKVGDTLSIRVLGRNVMAKVANLRTIDWGSFGANFALVFAPGTLEAAKPSHIAILRTQKAQDEQLTRAIGAAFPTISIMRIREALEAVAALFSTISMAISAIAAIVALSGALVLLGALAAAAQQRQTELALLKTLGVTRMGALLMMAAEFTLVAFASAFVAMALAVLAAWPIVVKNFEAQWAPNWFAAVLIIVLAALMAGFGGWLAGRAALSAPPARALRQSQV
jgi:putative ABC transport system permease protein